MDHRFYWTFIGFGFGKLLARDWKRLGKVGVDWTELIRVSQRDQRKTGRGLEKDCNRAQTTLADGPGRAPQRAKGCLGRNLGHFGGPMAITGKKGQIARLHGSY